MLPLDAYLGLFSQGSAEVPHDWICQLASIEPGLENDCSSRPQANGVQGFSQISCPFQILSE